MKRKFIFVIFYLALLCYPSNFSSAISSYDEIPSPAILQAKYSSALQNEKIKILIVPGHNPDSEGSEFRGIKERHLNFILGQELVNFLKTNPRFEVLLARDDKNYHPLLVNYWQDQKEAIEAFITELKLNRLNGVLDSSFELRDGAPHINASPHMVTKLYGINKYINDNQIDLVFHLHFNDYPRPKPRQRGQYQGFAIYVPDDQYKNFYLSQAVAESVLKELEIFWPPSNWEKEKGGLVSDQSLIALGAYNSLSSAALLIEYGYIYEAQLRTKEIRDLILKELAYRTYVGLLNFFETQNQEDFKSSLVSLLPKKILKRGDISKNVLFLQANILSLKFDLADRCALDGIFGECTEKLIKEFQKNNQLESDGLAGPQTIKKINDLVVGL